MASKCILKELKDLQKDPPTSCSAGRPKGVTPKYSLKPLIPRLSELLGVEVKMANDCIGEEVEKLVGTLPEGGVLLLENVRFYKEEEKNDPEFAKKLAALADIYVNDAFDTAHRAHASTESVTNYLKPSVAGYLMQLSLLFHSCSHCFPNIIATLAVFFNQSRFASYFQLQPASSLPLIFSLLP